MPLESSREWGQDFRTGEEEHLVRHEEPMARAPNNHDYSMQPRAVLSRKEAVRFPSWANGDGSSLSEETLSPIEGIRHDGQGNRPIHL